MKKSCFLGIVLVAAVGAMTASWSAAQQDAAEPVAQPATQPTDDAVQRARETVQLLDGIYKNTIVLITEKYVHDEDDFAAGAAAVELFRRIGKGGTHAVRLIDTTGDPYEPENVANDDFERQGVKQLKAGEDYHEQVIQRDGRSYLRAMTPVPVVMEKCVMCHSHYADVEEGEPIGALVYELPIK